MKQPADYQFRRDWHPGRCRGILAMVVQHRTWQYNGQTGHATVWRTVQSDHHLGHQGSVGAVFAWAVCWHWM